MRRLVMLLVAMLALTTSLYAQRTEQLLDKGWRFTREDSEEFSQVGYDDSKWQSVRIPHDWAIYGPFSVNNDKQNTAITQDGQQEAMEHAGARHTIARKGANMQKNSVCQGSEEEKAKPAARKKASSRKQQATTSTP